MTTGGKPPTDCDAISNVERSESSSGRQKTVSNMMREALPARMLVAILAICLTASGCSRAKYRQQADRDAYRAIAERNCDPRWSASDFSIEIDPRSRYYDEYDPDRSPMPLDDPAAHQYMHRVDGKKGWEHWHDNGQRPQLENPDWKPALLEYAEVLDDGSVKLDINSAVRLAYVHSPSHQSQLETLYLTALDVSRERWRLDTQFFGGYDADYAHNGEVIPPAIRFSPVLGRFVINPPIDGAGVEQSRLTLGRPFAGDPALQARRRFATAGEVLLGFANSFVFEFAGGDSNLSASLANFSFVQPLLRGAGRDIALEELTFVERSLLANLRAYSQFRQGFYTQIAIGELGVNGPRRGGFDTNLQSFSGEGFVGGYLGLLQQNQQIRNAENNLALQERTLAQLATRQSVGVIDLVQVDQFRQSVERETAALLTLRNRYSLSLDRFKTSSLGLPPDLEIKLDDSMIEQFQLVTTQANALLNRLVDLQSRVGELPDDVGIETLQAALRETAGLFDPIQAQIAQVQSDMKKMEDFVPQREKSMTEYERRLFREDRERLKVLLGKLELKFTKSLTDFDQIREELHEKPSEDSLTALIDWLSVVLRTSERLVLIQARARLELISVDPIDLESHSAFHIALDHRLDFMNGRAALVDSWRAIEVTADALQSVLNITADGNLRTARNNPVSFRAPTGNVRAGLQFDAPFTRLLERNDYRQALIEYQRDRRRLIQSRDALQLGLRELLRQTSLLRENLETQRRAVAIAIRRVDVTQAELSAPVDPPQPGQTFRGNPTTAINLLGAQQSLRDTQNAFLSVWLNYYATRLRLTREMGIMVLDEEGRWIEYPLPSNENAERSRDRVEREQAVPPNPDRFLNPERLGTEPSLPDEDGIPEVPPEPMPNARWNSQQPREERHSATTPSRFPQTPPQPGPRLPDRPESDRRNRSAEDLPMTGQVTPISYTRPPRRSTRTAQPIPERPFDPPVPPADAGPVQLLPPADL